MAKKSGREGILDLARGFQPACVLIAGAEVDVFSLFEELREDLAAAGFVKAKFLLRGERMDSVVFAKKP